MSYKDEKFNRTYVKPALTERGDILTLTKGLGSGAKDGETGYQTGGGGAS